MAKRYSLYSPTASFRRRVYRKSRGSTTWATIAAGLSVLRTVRRAVSRRPEVAAIERLQPGQSVTITAIAPPTKRERRAAKQAGRRRQGSDV